MNLKTAILMSLDNVQPCMLPQTALQVDVNAVLAAPVTRGELEGELARLEARGQVVGFRDELTDGLKWRITDNGRALLKAAQV
jgi:hypothetical protein